MSVYFIADTHFGHKDIHLKFRPQFKSVKHHDEFILNKILKVCGKRDTLYILGDVVIHKESLWCLEEICKNVEYVRIVLGNHDCERGRSGSCSLQDYLNAGVSSIEGCVKYKKAWLTHIPINPIEFPRRLLNVHGHLHDGVVDDPRYICVSCEQTNFTPVEYCKLLTENL